MVETEEMRVFFSRYQMKRFGLKPRDRAPIFGATVYETKKIPVTGSILPKIGRLIRSLAPLKP